MRKKRQKRKEGITFPKISSEDSELLKMLSCFALGPIPVSAVVSLITGSSHPTKEQASEVLVRLRNSILRLEQSRVVEIDDLAASGLFEIEWVRVRPEFRAYVREVRRRDLAQTDDRQDDLAGSCLRWLLNTTAQARSRWLILRRQLEAMIESGEVDIDPAFGWEEAEIQRALGNAAADEPPRVDFSERVRTSSGRDHLGPSQR